MAGRQEQEALRAHCHARARDYRPEVVSQDWWSWCYVEFDGQSHVGHCSRLGRPEIQGLEYPAGEPAEPILEVISKCLLSDDARCELV